MNEEKLLGDISFVFPLQETMEAKQILYIITNFTDDFDNSEIFIPLLPFLSSIYLGWIEKFQE
ncbi:hypothetical protein [Streptococcus anginosus]|uniref:hypothetical protein n=1 Tax=Streptococcus anginosus TaxID=1328 RepID=UPI001E564445|nr:hypothetical protein [Streptococcus anginosus]MDB8657033.1 hypothetical protein [Streptococcus anginosus]MDX5015540.1 hypothetical protein [Streptococcus anginosus]MDX5019661.1 hypothetical protein [Streptococcus anginosus]